MTDTALIMGKALPKPGALPRILFVNSFYAPEIGGGAEMTLHRLASGLHRRGYTIAAFTTGEAETIDEVDGVTVHRFPIDNSFRKLNGDLPNKAQRVQWQWRDRHSRLMAERLATLVRSYRPDIIQFHNLPGITRSVWEVPGAFGIPSVQVIHDLNLICPSSSMFKRGGACTRPCMSCVLFRRGFAAASSRLDSAVGVSRYVLDRVVREGYFPRADRRVIHNAQELPPPRPYAPGAALRFGYIGSLSPPKGLEWLIDQFDDAVGTLAIAGRGTPSYEAELRTRARGKRIEFVGKVDPVGFFTEIDVAIVPSIWNEALGNVAIEASALGRPVIASRRGGLPEIVRDGETGIMVDPDEPDSLGATMRQLAGDRALLMRMAAAAPAAVGKFTSVGRFLDDYCALYETLLANRRAPLIKAGRPGDLELVD